ncbi:MAG: hypothetical protein IT374_26510 [Polyangiaceae bacterium]|nr:hypothetical protein [Polyangiaceae bacterium]
MIAVSITRPATDRQIEILSGIADAITAQGYPPTLRQIGERFGVASTNAVHGVLVSLERRGLIRRDAGRSRAIVITPDGQAALAARRAR